MANTAESSNDPIKWFCAGAGFTLLVVGCALPFLCWEHWWPRTLLWVSCGVVFTAFMAGLWGWPKFPAKITFWGSLIFAALAVKLTDRGLPTYPHQIIPTAEWMKPLASSWVTQSPGQAYSIQTSSDLKRNGVDSLRFDLRGGEEWIDQKFAHSFRAEIATKDFPQTNSVKWYAFSVDFPEEFPIEHNRLVFAQWHSPLHLTQPDRLSPLAFHFTDYQLSITLRHSAEEKIDKPNDVPSTDLFAKAKLHKAKWNDFVVQVKWSYQEDGFVNVWWNNQLIVAYHGPVGYKEETAPEFRFGLYRDETDKTYIAYFNGVKSGNTSSDVGFNPAKAIKYQPED